MAADRAKGQAKHMSRSPLSTFATPRKGRSAKPVHREKFMSTRPVMLDVTVKAKINLARLDLRVY
jgi:hypothetical protein